MNLVVQSFWITILAGNISSLTALQTHSTSYTTSGSTSSISTGSASPSKFLLPKSLDPATWSIDETAEKIKIYHLTQKGVSCNSWFFETKYLEPLYDPSLLKYQPIPRYLAVMPPSTKYPKGRVVASCTGGVIKIFDLKNRTCTHTFITEYIYSGNSAAKLAVTNQNILLGYGPFFESYEELETGAWYLRASLTLNDTPNDQKQNNTTRRPDPTIDALAVLPNGCVVMLLSTKQHCHMLIEIKLSALRDGTIAKHTEHQKILNNHKETIDGLPCVLLPNNTILLSLTETKILSLVQQRNVWYEYESLEVPAPTAKLFELLALVNSSMKGKDCIAVKKFTQHDTVFYKCYYDSKELPSILLPDQQMAVIWKGKIMTFGLNEKALS